MGTEEIDIVNMGGGSELHRLKPMENYDRVLFEKLYKKCLPYIKRLASQVDARRFNVSPDIIQSYFCDKFIYVFNKYQAEYDENRLKATLLASLSTYKNRLLRNAYTEQSQYYQSLNSLEILFDNDKELVDEDEEIKNENLNNLKQYLESRLSPDAMLIFEAIYFPPPYIYTSLKNTNSKISILLLIDFFNLPRTKTSSNYVSGLRQEVDYFIEKAKEDLGFSQV